MELQAEISACETASENRQDLASHRRRNRPDGAKARSSADAPEIDGQVYINKPKGKKSALKQGEFTNVRITDADAHDLWAEPVAA